jgi:hypothetical protein
MPDHKIQDKSDRPLFITGRCMHLAAEAKMRRPPSAISLSRSYLGCRLNPEVVEHLDCSVLLLVFVAVACAAVRFMSMTVSGH